MIFHYCKMSECYNSILYKYVTENLVYNLNCNGIWREQKIQWNVRQERSMRFPALVNYSYAGITMLEITGWLFSSIIRMPSNYTLFGDLHPIQSSKYFSFSQHFTLRMFILITLRVNKTFLKLNVIHYWTTVKPQCKM